MFTEWCICETQIGFSDQDFQADWNLCAPATTYHTWLWPSLCYKLCYKIYIYKCTQTVKQFATFLYPTNKDVKVQRLDLYSETEITEGHASYLNEYDSDTWNLVNPSKICYCVHDDSTVLNYDGLVFQVTVTLTEDEQVTKMTDWEKARNLLFIM